MAREFKFINVDAMLESISGRTLVEWQQYMQVISWEQEQEMKKAKRRGR